MKIHYLSDIHLEFGKWRKAWDMSSLDCDIHVLAGDIGVGLQGLEFALRLDKPVIYVAGNHEFYGQRSMPKWWTKAREKVAGTHVHLLENEVVVIDGVRFLVCTLWTDFALFGAHTQQAAMDKAVGRMSDYAQIVMMDRQTHFRIVKLTPRMVLAKHHESRDFLERELNYVHDVEFEKTVVVTHHAPHAKSLPYGEPALSHDAYYASHLGHLVALADLWIHGHVHEARDYRPDTGGRVVCNCRGYKDNGPDAVEGFVWNRVVEI